MLPLDVVARGFERTRVIPFLNEYAQGSQTDKSMWIQEIQERGIPVSNWDGGCFPFPFLPPEDHWSIQGRGKANGNMSAMLIPLSDGGYFLSAGDAGAKPPSAITPKDVKAGDK